MKGFLKWLAVAGPSLAIVIPLAPVVYAVLGGGLVGGVACLLLGMVTYWAVEKVLNTAIEAYRWHREMSRPTKDIRTDWTTKDKSGKL
jgi:hypothetical protein